MEETEMKLLLEKLKGKEEKPPFFQRLLDYINEAEI
jgi:hypothetical protein